MATAQEIKTDERRHHHRGRRGSRRSSRKQDEDDESPALQSVHDIIAEMRRLPSGPEWSKRDRRHSEPFHQHDEASVHPLVPAPPQVKHEKGHLSMPKRVRSQSLPGQLNHSSKPPVNESATARRALYPTHLPVPDAIHLVQTRQLFSGVLSVDRQDSSDAHVACEELESDIYIYGSRNRNRALDGDHVAIELVDVDTMLSEKAYKKQARRRSSLATATLHPIPEDGIPPMAVPEDMRRPTYCGKVVCILERPKRMLFSGTLSLERPSSVAPVGLQPQHQKPSIIWFVPADKRLPLVAVPVKYAPYGFVKYHEEFRHRIFIGSIQRWPATSLHPFGTIEREIGYMGELGVHSQALMADHHLKDNTEFTDGVLKSAAAVDPVNNGKRLDLRHLNIFSVEKDRLIDHGFSIQVLEKEDLIEIGVHAVDLACLVRPNTLLDREARERAVTVQLVERQIPMFPSTFTQTHAELTPGVDRAALSVLCRVTRSGGKLMHSWIGKTIIKPGQHLQNNNVDQSMLDICKVLQTKRLKEGGSSLATSCRQFQLSDNGYPQSITRVDCDDNDVAVLLQEAIILCGQEVGQKITSRLSEHALLYRQEPRRTDTQTTQKRNNWSMYFCSGTVDIVRYRHHAYAAPLYTVFAEPLHKYACLAVQRQLHMALKGDKDIKDNEQVRKGSEAIEKLARHCNAKETAKDTVYEQSVALYTTAFIYRQCLDTPDGSIIRSATVVSLQPPHSITLLIPEYAMEKEIHLLSTEALHAVHYDPATNTMELVWRSTTSLLPTESAESELVLTVEQESNHYQSSTVGCLSNVSICISADIKLIRPALDIQLVNPFQ
ncbi:hypothetical protein BJV82DRAFT_606849 [Fennellomyces sp. T-0311]|nr:hypothetical protein BJV82DRAFT_606849 [Fennellomyces sp. T-0311]